VTAACFGAADVTAMPAASAVTFTPAIAGNSPDAFASLSSATNFALIAAGAMAATTSPMAAAAPEKRATDMEVSNATAAPASPRPPWPLRRRRTAASWMLLRITLPTVVAASKATALRYESCGPSVNDAAEKPATVVATTTVVPPTAKLGCGVGARVGLAVGTGVGDGVGCEVGLGVGEAVGTGEGFGVGEAVGEAVGLGVGGVGDGVGLGVGVAVGAPVACVHLCGATELSQ